MVCTCLVPSATKGPAVSTTSCAVVPVVRAIGRNPAFYHHPLTDELMRLFNTGMATRLMATLPQDSHWTPLISRAIATARVTLRP